MDLYEALETLDEHNWPVTALDAHSLSQGEVLFWWLRVSQDPLGPEILFWFCGVP